MTSVSQNAKSQGVDQIRADLDQLSLDLIATKRHLSSSLTSTSPSNILKSHPVISPRQSEYAAPTASRTSLRPSENDRDKDLPARPKLGARISSAFKIAKLSKRKKSIPVERQGLLERKDSIMSDQFPEEVDPPSRQGSLVSDTTLVDEDSAGYLLDLLAPLITGIQKLAPKIVQLSSASNPGIEQRLVSDTTVKDDFLDLCVGASRLLEALRQDGERAEDRDEHEKEMGGLMLVALMKKVDAEIQAVRGAHHHIVDPPILETVTQAFKLSIPVTPPSPSSPPSSSPLVRPANPFVLRSNSIRQNTSQNPSPRLDAIAEGRKTSVSIPIGVSATGAGGAPTAPGSFSTFVGGAQSSLWATNVRLASFQNSLLFSPSPIAVRRVVGHAAR